VTGVKSQNNIAQALFSFSFNVHKKLFIGEKFSYIATMTIKWGIHNFLMDLLN
jgi:hypothetical protein